MKLTGRPKRQVWFLGATMGILALFMLGQNVLEGREMIQQGILRGKTSRDVYEETFVMEQADGSRQDVTITVYPKEHSTSEVETLLDQAVETFAEEFLGENPSAMQVYSNLVFSSTFCDGLVTAQYETDAPLVVWEDGSVDTDSLGKDGELVQIQATFSCQDMELVYVCYVQVVLPPMTQAQQERQRIENLISQQEMDSRSDERFLLPQTIDGQKVTWHKRIGTEPLIFLFLGLIAALCIWKKKDQDVRKQKILREQQLLREYPLMVTQLSLLMGAGMPLFTAWERMVKHYLEEQAEHEGRKTLHKRQYLEEMTLTYREIKEGGNIRQAYEQFGNRIGLGPYRKIVALLLQNMHKGNRDLVQLLDIEAELVLAEQKNRVRKMGEEAGSKLLFPMLLLFVMILVIIMVPALQSF